MAMLEMGYTTDVRPGSPYAWFAVDREQQATNLVGAFQCARQHWQPWMGFMTVIYIPDPAWTQQRRAVLVEHHQPRRVASPGLHCSQESVFTGA